MPTLDVSLAPESGAVTVTGLSADMVAALDRHLGVGLRWESIVSVNVVDERTGRLGVTAIGGRHHLLSDAVMFVPHLPFQAGVRYRITFTPPRDPAFARCGPLSQETGVPVATNPPPRVTDVHPSNDTLPENVLRFYVTFSQAMRRGDARDGVVVLGPDGHPIADVLYRSPAELWSRDMRRLTVLMDPGRLKRQVGPHRQLGPPLRAGLDYTLAISGMHDHGGRRLAAPHRQHFRAADAVRARITFSQWVIRSPSAGTTEPVVLAFPGPLDWAMLTHAIVVHRADGHVVDGRPLVHRDGTGWQLVPAQPWTPGDHHVRVDPLLEDVCGNDVLGAFDRDLRDGRTTEYPGAAPLSFRVEHSAAARPPRDHASSGHL